MSGAAIATLVVGLFGAIVSAGAILIRLGAVLARLDLIDERQKEHRADITASRDEARDARHAAKAAQHAVELLAARLGPRIAEPPA